MATLNVLLADDNEDHRFLTKRAIKGMAAELDVAIFTAADGEEALEWVYGRAGRENDPRPHLLLLDIKMPRKDGFDVLKALRSEPATKDLPVVMFTSSENGSDVARARALGADDYVTKPMDPQAFAGAVRAIVWAWAKEARARAEARQPQ